MKLPSLLACIACSTSPVALAQYAANPPPPTASATFTAKVLPEPGKNVEFQELVLQPNDLGNLIDELSAAFTTLAREGGPGEYRMPTLVYGPGVREARIAAPLRLTGLRQMRAVDALALLATAGGCRLEPIYSVPSSAGEEVPYVIGYNLQSVASVTLLLDQTRQTARGGKGEDTPNDDRVVGVGLALTSTNGNIIVDQVTPGSPAARMGSIKPGDRILHVSEMDASAIAVPALEKELAKARETLGEQHPTVRNLVERLETLKRPAIEGVEVTGLALPKVVELIRGAPGSKVQLTLLSNTASGPVTYIAALVREKLPFSASGMVPKVAVFKEGTLTWDAPPTGTLKILQAPTQYQSYEITGSTVRPGAAPPPDGLPPGKMILNPFVRIYALGSILGGSDQAAKEDELKVLVAETLEAGGVSGSSISKLYIHTKSRVLIVKATAEAHEIIGQVVNALKENQLQQTIPGKP